MTEEFERDIRAFLRSIAGECANCFRRNQGFCDSCYSLRAKVLLQRLDVANPMDDPSLRCDIVSRMARIEAILKKARKPVLSKDIDISSLCTSSLKEYTLNKMIKLGKIDRSSNGNGMYVYFLKHKTKKGK